MLECWWWARKGLGRAVVVVVLACAALPLAATVHLTLTYQHDSRPWGKLAALLFRLIANVLILLCFAGDELERNSQLLSTSLYGGPWLRETASERLVRLHLMQATSKGLILPVKGLGRLNRPFCLAVVEKWFSFLQVLLKAQGLGSAD
ncbi:uncharacterized protein LOC117645905 [Thrips palmi]|uniref:Uncharacterized protein LOC117645905 n=1 Tax=Thrips palmi TaxID=161013 RepID=A0A6P8YYK5_THRPL|nr:uncharacterized protein LOC117645905 [Thrips palmi]